MELPPFLFVLYFVGISSSSGVQESAFKLDSSNGHRAQRSFQSSTSSTCSEYEWKCRGNGKCIDKSLRCNKDPDCSDASDEYDCGLDPTRFFECDNGNWITLHFRCDGNKDCLDYSDEKNCPIEEIPECDSSSYFQCANGDGCIPNLFLCDGLNDCQDQSDEKNCGKTSYCDDNQYECSSGICISHDAVCDGFEDCSTGEDEKDCGGTRCISNPNYYQCKNGLCVNPDELCNGVSDCDDGSDEGGLCSKKCNGECSHDCFSSPSGPYCSCPSGFHMNSEKICTDDNECKDDISVCDHFCKNVPGSYNCSCANDYRLESDNATCKSNHVGNGFLLIAKNVEIRELYLDSSMYNNIYVGEDQIESLAYDPVEKVVYWSTAEAILRKNTREAKVELFLTEGIQRVESLALDWYGRNLYIADSGARQIIVCNLKKLGCKVLVDFLQSPKAIQLDIGKKKIFWTDKSKLLIERADMDGSRRQIIVSEGLGNPNGLALDPPANRVYWMDALLSKVEHVDYEGNDRKHLPDGAVSHPLSMAIWEDKIYWSDLKHEYLRSCSKRRGRNIHTLLKGSTKNDFYGITLYHPSMFYQGRNPCSTDLCSHICLLSSHGTSGYKCACPEGMELSTNMHSCYENQNSSYPVVADGNSIYRLKKPKIGSISILPIAENVVERIGDIIYDSHDDDLIVSDVYARAIKKFSLKDGHVWTIVDKVDAVGVAHDWLRNNIYWVDGEKKSVEVAPIFGLHRKILKATYYNPTDIAVAPILGYYFVTDASVIPSIKRCDLDGSACKDIIARNLIKPEAVVVDRRLHSDKIYWSDLDQGHIAMANVDGSNIRILKDKLNHPISLLQYDNSIMWTSSGSREVNTFSITGNVSSKVELELKPAKHGIRVLRLAEVGWQPVGGRAENACKSGNGGCSHLCLGNSIQKEICACAIGYELAVDKKSCNTENCGKHFRKCLNSTECIPSSWWCDGSPDCDNGVDEKNCSHIRKPCSSDEFTCSPGICITIHFKCDGRKDCPNGADEVDCENFNCPVNKFKCSNGKCIPGMWRCDGDDECGDGSDEEGCPVECGGIDCDKDTTESSSETLVNTKVCSDQEIECFSFQGLLCVNVTKICDGSFDCPFGDDEQDCDCDTDYFFKCETVEGCVRKDYLCDDFHDCIDGSDEKGCNKSTTTKAIITTTENNIPWGCKGGEFKCNDGECIDFKRVCDGFADCIDSSDESNHCFSSCENNGKCAHECHKSTAGAYCSCHMGYHLAENGFDCDDDAECDKESTCSHYCTEEDGSYSCSCMKGYELDTDRRTCKLESGVEWAMLVGSHGFVNMTDKLEYIPSLSTPKGIKITSLDYDPLSSEFMYIDSSGNIGRIQKEYLTKFGSEKPILRQRSNPQGISIDYARRNFYFSEYFVDPLMIDLEETARIKRESEHMDEIYAVIQLCNLENGNCTHIYRAFNIIVPSTKVSSLHKKLFYCTNHQNHENQGQVVMSNLDGSSASTLRETKVVRCGSLAIDEPKKRIYWSDLALNSIQSVLWNGKGHTMIKSSDIHRPIGLTLMGNFVVWYNEYGNKLVRCHKYGRDCMGELGGFKKLNQTNNTALVAMTPQTDYENKCQNKSCSLCTVVHDIVKCMCPVGHHLSNEDSGCVKVNMCKGNPCNVGICELLSVNRFVCRCPPSYGGSNCEVRLDELDMPSNGGIVAAVVIILLLLIAIALLILWYKGRPFFIWKSKRQNANQTYRFSNPAFGVMTDHPIVGNSPSPSSCPSQTNSIPAFNFNNLQQNYIDHSISKAEEHQVNTSIDSAVASGTESLSTNVAPHHIDLTSPIPPEYQRNEMKRGLSPYNPTPPL